MSEQKFIFIMKNKKVIDNFLLRIGWTILILVIGVIVGFGGLCIVHMLPIERMHQNVLNSRDAINVRAQLVQGYTSTALDNYTDCIILNQVICPIDAPLFEKAVYNYQVNYWKKYVQPENLLRYLDGETGYRYQGYTHYWGGVFGYIKTFISDF